MENPRIYVASLSDYNNGRLEGKWFDLSDYSNGSDLMDAINEMLEEITEKYNDGEVREEWAVHDYEYIPSSLASEYMGENEFQQIYDIMEASEENNIPFEVLIERVGDVGSDDYGNIAESLFLVVDGNDETDIVFELEQQMGELGNDFWKNHTYIDDVTQRVMYGEDVDRFREDIEYENTDMSEDEIETLAEERADEEESRRNDDLIGYLEENGYSDIPSFVSKDYESAWNDLSMDYDVINYEDKMYVFSNNYGFGGGLLVGSLVGAYLGYKVGKYNKQTLSSGFDTEKRIGKDVKNKLQGKKTYGEGGWILMDSDTERKIGEYETESEARKMMYEYDGDSVIVEKSKFDKSNNSLGVDDYISMKRLLSEFRNEKEIFDGQIVNRGANDFKIKNDNFYIKRPNENWEIFRKIKFDEGGMIGFTNDPVYSKGNISVQRIGGSSTWRVAINKKSVGRILNAFTKEQAFSKAQKEKFVGGGGVDTISDEDLLRIKLAVSEAENRIKANDTESNSGGGVEGITKFVKENPQVLALLEKGGGVDKSQMYVKGGGVAKNGINWYKYDGQYEAEFGNFYLYVYPSTYRGYYEVVVKDGYRGDTISQSREEILGLDNAKELAIDIVGDYMKQFNKGGVVFTNYNGMEVMYEPNYNEYYVNDMKFDSMEEAKNYIDKGSRMDDKTIDAYRKGTFNDGGAIDGLSDLIYG